MRPAVRATWRRRTWLTVRSRRLPFDYLFIQLLFGVFKSRVFTGIKESVCWTPPPEVNPNKTCEYQALCSRFKDLLTLPGEFFNPTFPATIFVSDVKSRNDHVLCLKDGYFNEDAKYNLCYCESCHKLRGDEAYYKRGEPPRDYALPFGWCRFALRQEDDLSRRVLKNHLICDSKTEIRSKP